MIEQQSYSIVQFFPDPERHEGINLGVLLFDPRSGQLLSRFTADYARVYRSAKEINRSFLKLAVEEFDYRIKREVGKRASLEVLKRFQAMRSNNFRLTPFLPTFGKDIEKELNRLFDDLVGEVVKHERKQKVSVKLKKGLARIDALKLFDQKPDPVSLPRYHLKLKPDLAIRRQVYNLIEAARFDDPDHGLEQAGRHALAGRALHQNLGMKLIVVGDFEAQDSDYYQAIKEDLERSDTQLFRMDNLEELAHQFTLH